jgi:PAS domain S-box-containing protein
VTPRPRPAGGLSVRATLLLLAATGTAVVVSLALLMSLAVVPYAASVRRSSEPVAYLIAALDTEATALEGRLQEVREAVLAPRGQGEAAERRARARLAAMTAEAKTRRYDQVPPSIRSELAGVDADATRLEDRLMEVLDLVALGRRAAARARLAQADSLQLAIRAGLTTSAARSALDLVGHAAALERAAGRARWVGALLAGAAMLLALGFLVTVRVRIERPLDELTQALHRVRRGELQAALPVHRADEMGALASHFNAMTEVMAAARANEVTGRVQAEDALRWEQFLMNMLLDTTPDAIYFKDTQSRFLRVNRAMAVRCGVGDPAELVGKTDFDVFTPEHAAAAYRDELEIVRTGKPLVALEERETWPGRPDTWASTTKMPLRDAAGAIIGTFGISRDVTERRSLEQQFRQAQRIEAVGRLAGGVAHDFNNILTVITGSTELLLQDLAADDSRRGDLEEVRTAAQRAATLTRQLLAFSRKQVLQPRVLDLNTVVRSLDRMLQRLIGEDVMLELVLEPALHAVRADPGQIEQVIMNLAVNARDAMPKGGRLRIETANVVLDEAFARTHAGAVAGSYVFLRMSDTGVGMDAQTQSHLFEPFFTTKEAGKGTGLGLATVYGIVKQSGGYIWVDSESGRGASFTIYLPTVDAAVETPGVPAHVTPQAGGRETVLLVEDDAAVRVVATRALTEKGYRVLSAADGQSALELARGNLAVIQLLITDIVMPGMTGPDLAAGLRAERRDLPVIYMSGYTADTAVLHRILEAGVPFLQKPFTPVGLALKVREVLDASARASSASRPL